MYAASCCATTSPSSSASRWPQRSKPSIQRCKKGGGPEIRSPTFLVFPTEFSLTWLCSEELARDRHSGDVLVGRGLARQRLTIRRHTAVTGVARDARAAAKDHQVRI